MISVRLDGMDKATTLLADTISRGPTTLDRESARLSSFFNEKFDSFRLQLAAIDARNVENQHAAQTAVSAALLAQKEASSKTEISTTKQMDGSKEQLSLMGKAIDDKIDDLRQRVTTIESSMASLRQFSGTATQEQQAHSLSGANSIAIAALVIAVLVGMFTIFGVNGSINGTSGRITVLPPASVIAK
jgi:hypothetical protein